LYGKLICITNEIDKPTAVLAYADQLRRRTRVARDGSWFALIAFGLVVMVATFFYRSPELSARSPGCHAATNGYFCTVRFVSEGPFGAGLGTPTVTANVSPWATTYWTISIFVAICAIVAFYRFRARTSGVSGRIWPFACIGTAALALAVASRGWVTIDLPGDFWIRGTQALIVIAVVLGVLAAIERRWSFSLFVVGFLGLAILSTLYDVSNLFSRLGVGGNWIGRDQSLPNLILPGLYLIIGGVVFWLVGRRSRHVALPS
jgi:hypothetical protein